LRQRASRSCEGRSGTDLLRAVALGCDIEDRAVIARGVTSAGSMIAPCRMTACNIFLW